MSEQPLLVVFGGLPGTGKTSIARGVADSLGATFLRVDSIEAAIERAGVRLLDLPAGYAVAQAVTGDQLRSRRPVVVDAVNPVRVARAAWQQLADDCGARLRFVRVVVRDEGEHRRRVESRVADIEGHVLPSWADVTAQLQDEWTEPHLELDNSSSLEDAVATVLGWLSTPVDS
jgi:predicted kinase